MSQKIVFVSIALILALSAGGSEKESLKPGDQAPKFVLRDAYDREYSLDMLLNKEKKIIILIMGNRSVRKHNDRWAIELDRLYGKNEGIAIFMIADLRGLPFFATESVVKWGVKREKPPVTLLLDWGGKVNELYNTQKGKSNLFIIDRSGKISYYNIGKYSSEVIKAIQTKVQDNLRQRL